LCNICFLYYLVVTKAFVASGCIARHNELLVVINDILNLHKFSLVYRKNHAQVLLGRSSSRNKQKKRETTRNYFSIINYLHLECYQGCIRLIPHKSVSIKIHCSYLCGKNIYFFNFNALSLYLHASQLWCKCAKLVIDKRLLLSSFKQE